MAKYFIVILCILSAWLALKWEEANSRIEAGVINEMFLAGDRDFLIRLPEFIKEADNKDKLFNLLKKNYPNVLVEDRGQNICWGHLRLNFDSQMKLYKIDEECS